MNKQVKKGEIYFTNLDPVVGSEQGGKRPVLVIQKNELNKCSPTVIVAAITSKEKRRMSTHFILSCNALNKKSIVLLEQIRTIDKSRLIDKIGEVSDEEMDKISAALKTSIDI